MLKKSIADTPAFQAGDDTIIREVLHPKNEKLKLPYSLAFAILEQDLSSRPHLLKNSSEVLVFTQGKGKVYINDESTSVQAGDVVFIPGGARQYVKNEGEEPLKFWCIVAPPWSEKDEMILG